MPPTWDVCKLQGSRETTPAYSCNSASLDRPTGSCGVERQPVDPGGTDVGIDLKGLGKN